jgi:hypothetical protein
MVLFMLENEQWIEGLRGEQTWSAFIYSKSNIEDI